MNKVSIGEYNTLVNKYNEVYKENKQLKIQISAREEVCNRLEENWNTLKKHCNTMLSIFEKMNEQNKEKQLDKYVIYDKFLSKMQELEQGSDSDE